MSRGTALIGIASLTLVVILIRFAHDWLRVPEVSFDVVDRTDPSSSNSAEERATPDPAPLADPSPTHAPSASRVESQSGVIIILDRAYDADSSLAQSAGSLQEALLEALLPRFRESHQVVAEEQEVLTCGPSVRRSLKGGALDGRDPKLMGRSEQREFSVSLVIEWKTERELFDAFGGRVTSDEYGRLTAVGARTSYLREQHAKGAFAINDAELAAQFWSALEASSTSKDSDVTAIDFSTPWWSRNRR